MTTWLVSRHPGAISWFERRNLQLDRTVAHLDPATVKDGDIVIGTLPIDIVENLCSRGVRYFHLAIQVPCEWRGRELTDQQLDEFGAELKEYVVLRR